jgi:RNA polymerase sigma factor (sigma-70 family)
MNSMPEPRPELLPTRQSLLSRLKDKEDNQSWRHFLDLYWKLIYGVATQAGLTHDEAQDVVQETVISVARTMDQFKYDPKRCSIKTWLQHLTRKRIADQFRKRRVDESRHEQASLQALGTAVNEIADPGRTELDKVWDEEWEKNLMDAALERVKARVNPKHYQIFHLYALRGLSVNQVCAALGVNSGHVYLAKHRVSAMLKKEIKKLDSECL